MKLRTKLMLVIAPCLTLSIAVVSVRLSQSFLQKQQKQFRDSQANLSLLVARQIKLRSSELMARLKPVAAANSETLSLLNRTLPHSLRVSRWTNGKLDFTSDPKGILIPPPHGISNWSLQASHYRTAAIRWIGRYGNRVLAIDMDSLWFEGQLDAPYENVVRLIDANGLVVFQSGAAEEPSSRSRESFNSPEAFAESLKYDPGIPTTKKYTDLNGNSHLGTFLKMGTTPSIHVNISTPWRVIDQMILEITTEAIWVGLVALLLATAFAAGFAASLTRPLSKLTGHLEQLGTGNFETLIEGIPNRKDEIGLVARAFNKMVIELAGLRREIAHQTRLAALGNFSASIAHEIKNPLASMLANLQLALRQMQKHEKRESVEQKLFVVEKEIRVASNIINRLLRFSHQTTGPRGTINLAECLKRWVEDISPLATSMGIVLEFHCAIDSIVLSANSDEIEEVFQNLLQNAFYALKEKETRRVRISLEVKGKMASLIVEDTGAGIPNDIKPRVFEPFFTTKPIGEGTGLGLPVCYGIAQSHGGKILVSDSPLGGARFEVLLPIKAALPQAA